MGGINVDNLLNNNDKIYLTEFKNMYNTERVDFTQPESHITATHL